LEDVAALVALLDCLPLAIELAAARSRVLSTEKIVARLSDRFQLLKSNEFKTRRQATLRGAIDWSWDLLSEWERSTLAQVSVFEGGFDLEAIEHVVSFDGMPNAPWPVDVIQALVEQSLIRPTGDDRFDLLVSVREYAAEKLAAVSQGANVHDRHAEYFAEFGAKEAVEAIYRHGGVQVSDRMVLEYDNLKAALLHGAKSGNKAVALACFRAVITVIERRGPFAEAHELTSRLLDSLSLTRHERGDCLVLQGRIERLSGHREKATKYLSEAAAIGRELQDPTLEVRGLRNLAFLLFYKDEMHAADEAWERSEALARRHRLVIELSAYLVERCDIFFGQGETKQGMAMLQEGMALAREVGNDSVLMLALTIMSYKDPESSAELLGEALRIARAWRDIRSECSIYPALGYAAVNRGDIQKAYAYYLKSLRLSMNVGATFRSAITLTCLCELSLMLANHDDARDYALRAAAYGEDSWVFFKGVSNGILAMLAIYEGRYEDALALLEIAESLTHAASHRSETAKLMTVKAQALHLMGRTKEAAAQYQAVVRLIRDDGALEPYQVWLSEGYLKMIGQG
jgi:tetratricopeptide (TPR) repeat protein